MPSVLEMVSVLSVSSNGEKHFQDTVVGLCNQGYQIYVKIDDDVRMIAVARKTSGKEMAYLNSLLSSSKFENDLEWDFFLIKNSYVKDTRDFFIVDIKADYIPLMSRDIDIFCRDYYKNIETRAMLLEYKNEICKFESGDIFKKQKYSEVVENNRFNSKKYSKVFDVDYFKFINYFPIRFDNLYIKKYVAISKLSIDEIMEYAYSVILTKDDISIFKNKSTYSHPMKKFIRREWRFPNEKELMDEIRVLAKGFGSDFSLNEKDEPQFERGGTYVVVTEDALKDAIEARVRTWYEMKRDRP